MERNLQIEGMMCQHCVMHVQKALAALPGVEESMTAWAWRTTSMSCWGSSCP